jgi:hypothetical protein
MKPTRTEARLLEIEGKLADLTDGRRDHFNLAIRCGALVKLAEILRARVSQERSLAA